MARNNSTGKVNYFSQQSINFFLGGLLLFHAISNYIWISLNNYPYGHDEPTHFKNTIKFFKILREKSFSYNKVKDLLWVDPDYPPFYYMLICLLFLLFGVSYKVALLLNNALFLLTILLIYLTGKVIKDKREGFFAALFYSLSPAAFSNARFYNLETMLVFLVSLSYYIYFKFSKEQRKGYILILGLLLGLGLLTKQYFPIFIIPIFISKTLRKKPKILSLILLIALLIAGPFYLGYFIGKGSNIVYRMKLIEEEVAFFPYPLIFFYPLGILIRLINPFILPLLLLAILKLKSQIFTHQFKVIILWILFPLLILTFIPCKYFRYILPSLPAIFLLTGIAWLKNLRYWEKGLGAVSLSAAFIFYLGLSFHNQILNKTNFLLSYVLPKKMHSLLPPANQPLRKGKIEAIYTILKICQKHTLYSRKIAVLELPPTEFILYLNFYSNLIIKGLNRDWQFINFYENNKIPNLDKYQLIILSSAWDQDWFDLDTINKAIDIYNERKLEKKVNVPLPLLEYLIAYRKNLSLLYKGYFKGRFIFLYEKK